MAKNNTQIKIAVINMKRSFDESMLDLQIITKQQQNKRHSSFMPVLRRTSKKKFFSFTLPNLPNPGIAHAYSCLS